MHRHLGKRYLYLLPANSEKIIYIFLINTYFLINFPEYAICSLNLLGNIKKTGLVTQSGLTFN